MILSLNQTNKRLKRKQIDKVTLLPINDPPKPSKHPTLPTYNREVPNATEPTAAQTVSPTGGSTQPGPATITGVTFSPESPTKISPISSPKSTSPQHGSRIPEFSSSDDEIVPPYKPTVRLPTSPDKPDINSISNKLNSEAIERQQSETKIEVQKEDESQIENETSIVESKNVQSTKSESHSKRTLTTRNQFINYEGCLFPMVIVSIPDQMTIRKTHPTLLQSSLLTSDHNVQIIN